MAITIHVLITIDKWTIVCGEWYDNYMLALGRKKSYVCCLNRLKTNTECRRANWLEMKLIRVSLDK